MFDNKTTHDFGVVARGAKVEHRFVLENIYEEDVHVRSIGSSCGCSSPQINRKLLKTWEKAEVLVTVDTRGFFGQKDATITVAFDKPYPAEVQLHVRCYIRSDIVVQPGVVSFGPVTQGAAAEQSVTVSYAGRPDWRIERVECANPSIEASVAETSRTAGQVTYRLTAKLKPNAPPGYIRDQLVLVTNDFAARSARVPVSVEGLVVSSLTVRPSPLMMGSARIGEPLTRNLVVQGQAPFKIVAVHCDDERFECRLPADAKAAQVLPVTFLAKDPQSAPGTVKTKLRIETDQTGANTAEVDVSVQLQSTESAQP